MALIHEYDFVPAPQEPGLATQPLYRESMYLAAPARATPAQADPARTALAEAGAGAGAGAAAPGPEQGAVLRAHADAPWITATPGTLCHAMALRACQAAGFTPRIRHRVDEFPTVLALVAAGQGVAVVPQLGVMGPVDPAVSLTRLLMERRTKIAFRSGAAAHPAVAAFGAALRAAVPPELATPASPA
ncbi:LysR substrate-binding domain-containing protein [Streptomyces sp. NPDC049949]|uniref:LysR substrate-binding domain-containing protein n=1 Tax=Streptomyces sp. NPDC049949 TaxID=3154627 RepID=UPI003431DC42